MKRDDLIGKRIQYRKSGSRHGWTGQIVDTWKDSVLGGATIKILYDNGTVQNYCIEALEGFGISRIYPEAAGYLHFIGGPAKVEIPQPTYYVHGDNGKWAFYNESEAHDFAKRKAKDSTHNRPFEVLKVTSKYQRAEPPVERTDF